MQKDDAAWSLDLEGRVKPASGLTLAIGDTNVFNRHPDQTTLDSSYGGAFPYNVAHSLGISGAYDSLNASTTFGK